VYRVDFGADILPRHVEAFLPTLDGLVRFMEVGEDDMKNSDGGRWYDEHVSVSLHLRADMMRRIMNDPWLRKYRDE
jgi:hypothetical protein